MELKHGLKYSFSFCFYVGFLLVGISRGRAGSVFTIQCPGVDSFEIGLVTVCNSNSGSQVHKGGSRTRNGLRTQTMPKRFMQLTSRAR